MSKTFLQLVNRVLVRLNEVPLNEDNFETARGIHAFAKDSVLDTLERINKEFIEWPFDAAQHTMLLATSVAEYEWPDRFRTVDWDSFTLKGNLVDYNIEDRKLNYVERELWYDYYRGEDNESSPLGRSVPSIVFETHGLGFGVSPMPDEPYQITFRYFRHPPIISEASDLTNIPEHYEYIIIDGAMFHMKLFKEDSEGAQIYDAKFKEGTKMMKQNYGRKWEAIRDRRIARNLRGFF